RDVSACLDPDPELRLSSREVESLWADLCSPDAARAYRASATLSRAPRDVVPFLAKRLQPVHAPEARGRELLAALDSPRYAVRTRATAELVRLEHAARPLLESALKEPLPLEVHRRVAQVLQGIKEPGKSPQRLGALRAVRCLERTGTAAARQVLRELAK